MLKNLIDGYLINNRFKVDKVISTIPLPKLVEAMSTPEDVINAASRLDHKWAFLQNVKNIFLMNTTILDISSENLTIIEGIGLYTSISTRKLVINTEKPIDITILLEDNKCIIENVKKITVISKNR